MKDESLRMEANNPHKKSYQSSHKYNNKSQPPFRKNSEKNKDHQNILPGLKPVLELLQSDASKIDQIFLRKGRSGKESDYLLDLCREKHVRFALVNDDAISRLCDGTQHQGVAARLRTMSYIQAEDLLEQAFDAPLPLIIALDQVLDPGNVGTLVRTLYALGAAGLIVPTHNSAFLGPGAHRSAAGTLEKLPIAEVVNLARSVELAARSGFTTYSAQLGGINALAPTLGTQDITGTSSTAGVSSNQNTEHKLQLPALLVLGSEDKGIRPGVQKHCQHSLSIPFLRDFDSLNVAQAGGILTSCFLRAHRY